MADGLDPPPPVQGGNCNNTRETNTVVRGPQLFVQVSSFHRGQNGQYDVGKVCAVTIAHRHKEGQAWKGVVREAEHVSGGLQYMMYQASIIFSVANLHDRKE